MSSVQGSINFSKNRINTNLVDYQEQMNKSTCNYSNSVSLKHTQIHSVNLQTCTE